MELAVLSMIVGMVFGGAALLLNTIEIMALRKRIKALEQDILDIK